jgi:hypothetical protein
MTGTDRERTSFGAFLRGVGDELAGARRTGIRTPAPADPTWPRLSKGTTPIAGESLRGLVARACSRNFLPNSWGLLQHLGQLHRNRVLVAEDENIDPAQLAWAMRVPEPEVHARRYGPLGRGRVSFFGLDVNRRRIETRSRRFSPAVFRMDRGGEPHFHRALWELRDVPFCIEGWDMLQERCFCEQHGVVQGWSRTATRIEECDRCGDPLAWLEPIAVPERMRPRLRLLEALIAPDPDRRTAARELLPQPLRQADRSAVFQVVMRLADAIDPHASDHSEERPDLRLRGLHAACTALRRWPEGLSEIRLPSGSSISSGSALRAAWNSLAPLPPAPADPMSSCRAISGAATPGSPVGIRRATEIARLSPEVLTAAWNHGLVTRLLRRHGDRTLPAFDAAELSIFGDAWRQRRGCDSLAYELGVPRYGVEDMAASGALEADGPALPGEGPHFTPAGVRAFMDALENAAQPVQEPVTLRRAMRLVGGRLKPWGAVLDDLLDGTIPFGLREGCRLADRVLVPSSQLSALEALHARTDPDLIRSPLMIQADALEVLNAPSDLAHLLDGLHTSGRNPRVYLLQDVERLARTIITIPEIAARLATDPATTYQELRRRDLLGRAVRQGAWPRSILADLV